MKSEGLQLDANLEDEDVQVVFFLYITISVLYTTLYYQYTVP